jgi:hypothetical protein
MKRSLRRWKRRLIEDGGCLEIDVPFSTAILDMMMRDDTHDMISIDMRWDGTVEKRGESSVCSLFASHELSSTAIIRFYYS